MTKKIKRGALCAPSAFVALILFCGPSRAENITFPSDSGVTSVLSFGATPNDGSDDTTAFQNAIKDVLGSSQRRILYVPNGVYNLSNRLEWRNSSGAWATGLTLQGQSRNGTVLRLNDNVFTDAANPRAVLHTATQNAPKADGSGTGQAFSNSIRNLTVDTGSGNTGAIGIDYLSNNSGGIYDVTIRTSDGSKRGVCGLSMRREWPGPSLIKNVSISGFEFGIDVGHYEYSLTFEHIALDNQRQIGVRNAQNVLSIRKLTSQNSVPAIYTTSNEGAIYLTDATLNGGAGDRIGIDFRGSLLARNVTINGYGTPILNGNNGTTVSERSISEYTSNTPQSLFDSHLRTLNLPVEETPNFNDENLGNWARVDGSGADDTAAIQAALNSGKNTVYFPSGQEFKISGSVTVPSGVRRIVGFGAKIEATGGLNSGTGSAFRFLAGGDSVTFEQFTLLPFNENPFYWFEHGSTRTLIVKNVCRFGGLMYRNTVSGGKVFVEDTSGARVWDFNGQNVWARSLNTESLGSPHVRSNGGSLWILGYKTEGAATCIESTNGSRTEVFGGQIYPLNATTNTPIFNIVDSWASLAYMDTGSQNYELHVRETRGSVTRNQTRTMNRYAGLWRDGRTMTLFSAHGQRFQNGAIYELTPQCATGTRLDVSGAGNFNGANVNIWNQNGNAAQRWRLEIQNDGAFEIVPQCATSRRLEVSGDNNGTSGANVAIWDDLNQSDQRWTLINAGGGWYEIAPGHNQNLRLDVSGGGSGSNVQLYNRTGGSAQKWRFTFVSPPAIVNGGIYELEPQCAPNTRLDVVGGVNADANVTTWIRNGAPAQRWQLQEQSAGIYELAPQCSTSRRLEVAGVNDGGSGANVGITSDHNGPDSRWRLTHVGDGWYELTPQHNTGLRLEVAGGGGFGTNVQIWTSNNATAQRWRLIPYNGAITNSSSALSAPKTSPSGGSS